MHTHMLKQIALLAMVATTAHSQTPHPNFSGSWTLDAAHSDTGPGVPESLTYQITQTPSTIKVDRVQTTPAGDSRAQFVFAMDGSTTTNQFSQGGVQVNVTSTVTWEGDVPVFKSHVKAGENEIDQVDRWTMADGGRTLKLQRTISVGGQTLERKMVLEKRG